MANPLITGRDLQSLVQSVAAVPSTSITSNAAGTYSAVTGLTIDRATIQSNGGIAQQITNAMPLGCLFILQYDLSIAAATIHGSVMFEADVKSANRYIRLDVTPTLTSTGTIDTASFYGVAVLHGF